MVQTSVGEVIMHRAESCVISGTRVVIDHAVNCEIIANEVVIAQAEGCAIAARKVSIEMAGPRKEAEMLVFALCPDSGKVDEVIGLMGARVAEFTAIAAQHKAALDALTSQPDVRKYVVLASKIRKKELELTAEQVPMFQKMAAAVGPALKAIAKVSLDVKAAETEAAAGQQLIDTLASQLSASAGVSQVALTALSGDTVVRVLKFNPDGSSTFDLPPKDIKARVRAANKTGAVIYAGANGPVNWITGA